MIRPTAGTTWVAGVVAVVLAVAGFWIWWLFDDDLQQARAHSLLGLPLPHKFQTFPSFASA